jgi:hypothetical protein
MRPARAATATAVTVGLLVLGGCATPATALPAGVTVSVFQNRFDYSLRQLELKVSNGTDSPLTVTMAAFDSTRFATPAVWDRPQLVPDGSARDLKVQLGEPVCDDSDPKDTVVIDFTLADGRSGTATVVPSDEQGKVDAIHQEDCLGESVAAIAMITAPPTIQWTPGAHGPASLDLAVVPTGAAGTLTIHSAKGTVLLSLLDEGGGETYDVPVERVVDAGSGASVIRLAVVPARCDPHAIEEDKRGTFFPLRVETSDGHSGTIYVAVSDDVRRSLYEFYADYCGLP